MELSNERRLELTLANMMPYDLRIKNKTTEKPVDGHDIQEQKDGYFDFEYKPILHSMEKLTEGVLEGGLIPIVEIAKMQYKEVDWQINNGRCFGRLNAGIVLEFSIDDEIPFFKEYGNNIFGQFPSQGNYDDMYLASFKPSEIAEFLKSKHFNLYNLPKSMYIEKSNQ